MFEMIRRYFKMKSFVIIYMCEDCDKLHILTDVINREKLINIMDDCSGFTGSLKVKFKEDPEFVEIFKQEMKDLGIDLIDKNSN